MINVSSPAMPARSEGRIDDPLENALDQRQQQQRPLNSGCIGRPRHRIDSKEVTKRRIASDLQPNTHDGPSRTAIGDDQEVQVANHDSM